jgi:phosphohistidine phosphatase
LQLNVFREKVFDLPRGCTNQRSDQEATLLREDWRMDLYLARHGEAVIDLIDPNRPLTRAGRESVDRVARLAAGKSVQVSVIYHSGILRAGQTAEILASHLAPGGGVRVMSGLRPDDDPALAAAELAVGANPVMLVGHLPHLKRLAALLSRGDADADVIDFMPATMVCYSREGSLWKLNWMLTP